MFLFHCTGTLPFNILLNSYTRLSLTWLFLVAISTPPPTSSSLSFLSATLPSNSFRWTKLTLTCVYGYPFAEVFLFLTSVFPQVVLIKVVCFLNLLKLKRVPLLLAAQQPQRMMDPGSFLQILCPLFSTQTFAHCS